MNALRPVSVMAWSAMLALVWLCLAGPLYSDDSKEKRRISMEVLNRRDLLLARTDATLQLDFSGTVLPPKTRLKLEVWRVYPVLEPEGFRKFRLRFDQFRLRARNGVLMQEYPLSAGSGSVAAVGDYEVVVTVDKGQHPDVETALGAELPSGERRLVFVGAKSLAVRRLLEELNDAVESADELYRVYVNTDPDCNRGVDPQSIVNIGTVVNPIANGSGVLPAAEQGEEPDADDESDNGNIDEDNGDNDGTESAPEDGDAQAGDAGAAEQAADAPVYLYTFKVGTNMLFKQATALFATRKSLTMPEVNALNLQMEKCMLDALSPMRGPGTVTTFERMTALSRMRSLQLTLMNLFYYLDDAYTRLDPMFDSLIEAPDAALQAKVAEEWTDMAAAVSEVWQGIEAKYLSREFLAEHDAWSGTNDLTSQLFQLEADANGFADLLLLNEEEIEAGEEELNFPALFREYSDAFSALQSLYLQRLQEGPESVAVAELRRRQDRMIELTRDIRKVFSVKGEIQNAKVEEDTEGPDSLPK